MRLLFAATLCGILSRAWHPLSGADDVWAHAFVGRWMWEHGTVPHRTLGLWGGELKGWIAHSWASQVVFFALLKNGGWLALVFCGMIMSALPFALLWWFWARCGRMGLLAPPLFILAAWVSSPRFRTRPELFSALALAILLIFLSAWPRRARRELALLPVLFCVWANFHGGVAIGLLLLGATVVGDGLQSWVEERDLRVGWLALAALFCFLAVLLNPYGAKYLSALTPVSGPMFAAIDEWKPFWKSPVLPRQFVLGEGVLWGVALAAWIMNPRRRWAHALWLLLMGAAFIMARRQLWLLAITDLCVLSACAPVLEDETLRRNFAQLGRWFWFPFARPLARFSERTSRLRYEFVPHLGRNLLGALVVMGVGAWLSQSLPAREGWPRPALQPGFPHGAAPVLKKLRPRRLFNDYENSSYLQWALRGEPRLYIDLLNAYPDDLLMDYLDMSAATPRGKRLWAKLRPDAVYIRPHEPTSALADLTNWLNANRDYRRIYARSDGTIWVKRKR